MVPSLLTTNMCHNVWERVTMNQQIDYKSQGHTLANYEDTRENWIGGTDDKKGIVIFKTHLHKKNSDMCN